jgi:hypothetical protein
VNVRGAIAGGKSAAEEVIAFRAKQRRKRAALEQAMPAQDAHLEDRRSTHEGASIIWPEENSGC